eukprot:Gb_03599 [translate_table: standard]
MRGAKRGYHIFLHVGDGIRIRTGEERQGWRCRGQASWWAVEMVERRAHAAGDVVQQRGEPGRTRPNRIITFKTRADLTREVVRRTKRARGTSVWIHRPPREEYRVWCRHIFVGGRGRGMRKNQSEKDDAGFRFTGPWEEYPVRDPLHLRSDFDRLWSGSPWKDMDHEGGSL